MSNFRIKGDNFEKKLSEKYHNLHTPVLISSKVLRDRSCGQIDVCFLSGRKLTILESKIGQSVSKKQQSRLKNSGVFLGEILDMPVFIKLVFAK